MNYFRSHRFKDIPGTAAALTIAITSLVAAICHVYVVPDLKHHGATVDFYLACAKHVNGRCHI